MVLLYFPHFSFVAVYVYIHYVHVDVACVFLFFFGGVDGGTSCFRRNPRKYLLLYVFILLCVFFLRTHYVGFLVCVYFSLSLFHCGTFHVTLPYLVVLVVCIAHIDIYWCDSKGLCVW